MCFSLSSTVNVQLMTCTVVQSLHHFSRNKTWEISAQNRCQSAEELNKKSATGLRPAVQSCEEDQFQSDWKESLQTKLTNETMIMKSNSIIDQNSTSGDDELNDETIDAEDSEDDAKLVVNGVTLQAPEPVFKSAGLQTFKSSCTEVMNFVTSTSELLSPCQSCCNLQHVLPEHQGDRVDVPGGDARASGASDGRGSVTS